MFGCFIWVLTMVWENSSNGREGISGSEGESIHSRDSEAVKLVDVVNHH